LEATPVVKVVVAIKETSKYFSWNVIELIYAVSMINFVNNISYSINIQNSHIKKNLNHFV
jgi:hypothetical protein